MPLWVANVVDLDVIASVCSDRKFFVRECGVDSAIKDQCSGVCQGCPLSPFLFGIVMTVLMTDAYASLPACVLEAHQANRLYDILYADDTLLLGLDASHVCALSAAVEATGAQYGLALHWGKTQAVSFGTDTELRRPDGSVIEESQSLIYLGALIHSSGRIDAELSR